MFFYTRTRGCIREALIEAIIWLQVCMVLSVNISAHPLIEPRVISQHIYFFLGEVLFKEKPMLCMAKQIRFFAWHMDLGFHLV